MCHLHRKDTKTACLNNKRHWPLCKALHIEECGYSVLTLWFSCSKHFPICWLWAYLMKVIPICWLCAYLMKVFSFLWLWAYLMKVFSILWLWAYLMKVFSIFWLWAYLMMVISETCRAHYNSISIYMYNCVDSAAGKLLVRPVVWASAQTWFIRYIFYWNLQFLHNIIINKTKEILPHTYR